MKQIFDAFPSQLSRYTSDGYTVNLIPSMVAGALGVVGQNRILFLRFFPIDIIFSNNMMFPPPVLIPVLRVIFILWEMFIEVTFRFHESSHFHYMRCVSRTFGFRELSVIVDFIYSGVRIGGTCCGKGVLS